MATAFDLFNRPLPLRRIVAPTSGNFDASDVWQPPTDVPKQSFQGHMSLVTMMSRESEWKSPGPPVGSVETGSLRLFTETKLNKGDIVEADQEDGSLSSYRVMALVRANRFIAAMLGQPVRFEYEIREVPQ